jgi:pentose-5-phosphate-3-epimerase
MLTDRPLEHLREYKQAAPGAVCFQLDAIDDHAQLVALIARIQGMGACPSPVIETVGTERRPALPPAVVRARLAPVLAEIGMLTFQAAATAARSSAGGTLDVAAVRAYLAPLRARFAGTVQLQGGITTATIADAVRLGADFVVCGSELFRSPVSLAPGEVVDALLAEAAEILTPYPQPPLASPAARS